MATKIVAPRMGKSKEIAHEQLHSDEIEQKRSFILAHYLESMHKVNQKPRPKSSKSYTSMSGSQTKIRKFGSQPSLYEDRPKSHKLTGTVAKKTTKEMGAYAWTPLATRTAVGFGEDPFARSQELKKKRPISAPVYKMQRATSLTSLDTKSSSSWTASLITSHSSLRRRKSKQGYMAYSITLCVHAFPNGSRENSVRVTANSILQLLEEATQKLSLPSAGRKIFLPDGNEVTDARQLYKDCIVYISMGEAFKDPYDALRDKERVRLSSSWTMNGIMLPDEKKSKKKVSLSKRMKDLVESQKKRILVFRNGESREGVEVVANRFDEFMIDCTAKLGLSSGARALFDWQGKEVQSFSDVPSLGELQTQSAANLLGPLWVTKGERFSPTGAYNFLFSLVIEMKRKIKEDIKRLELLKARENGNDIDVQEIMSMTHVEIEKEIEDVSSAVDNQRISLKRLKSYLKITAKKHREETNQGSSYKFQHISEVNENSRLLGVRGYRLKLRLNGQPDCEPIILHFSNKDIEKGKKTKEESLQGFFDMLNGHEGLKEAFIGHGRRSVFRRAFQTDGKEIKDFSDIGTDAELWLSFGEDFVPTEYDVISLAFDKVKLLNLWNEKSFLQRESWLGADEKITKPSLWSPTTTLSINDLERVIVPDATSEEEKLRVIESFNTARIPTDSLVLQCKKDPKLVLYPDIQAVRIGREQDADLWGVGVRQWILTRDGTIMNKAFRNLVLSIKQQNIAIVDGEKKIEGHAVCLAERIIPVLLDEKEKGNQEKDKSEISFGKDESRISASQLQKWKLTSDGHIVSVAFPSLYLTSLTGLKVETIYAEKKEEKNDAKEKKTSSSDDSSDEMSSDGAGNDDNKSKSKKKLKKKSKKGKQKKKWWNFDSSSSSDSSDSESGRDKNKRNSTDSIIVRMKGTSSEDDKTNTEQLEEGEKQEENNDGDVDGENKGNNTAEDRLKNLPEKYGGETALLGIFEGFASGDYLRVRQRWAIKKSDPSDVISDDTLPDKWIRQGLTWPVNEADAWIEDVVDGYLLPCAPKLKRKLPEKEKTTNVTLGRPARLKVLKNGEPDQTTACIVVGPDLSNMTKKVRASLPLKWKKGKGEFQDVQSASVAEVEFEQFLDKCTEALNLPFAARRLFDENGKELFSLAALERDQLVYVSTGDSWINPNLTYSEQQRRLLLANLASDVNKIRNFITLRDQTDMILQVNGALHAGSSVIISRKTAEDDDENEDEEVIDDQQENEIRDLHKASLTSHQIAHIRSEERLQSIRDRIQQDSGFISIKSTGENSDEEFQFSNPSLARKFSRSTETVKYPSSAYHQWSFNDGFIHLKANKKLVLGVQQNEESKGGQDVILCNKKVEDSFQRWIISEDGFIHLKCNPQLVLTVATPLLKTDPFSDASASEGYDGSRVILGRRLDCLNGNSHQMFSLDAENGIINAFATDAVNSEITAANKSSVCTFSVLGSRSVFQMGYIVQDGTKSGQNRVLVCESCGKAIRGKQKLQRIAEIAQFVCAMGTPEEFGLTTTGSFRCLTSKVDLSQKEAESTLLMWEMQLSRLQKESSVRVIAYELNLAQTTPSVRICARKNGESGDGVIVIGNSINQFLDMSTYKLGLTQAARKMYTIEGELITDMSQLLQPYYPDLCMPIQRSMGNTNTRKGSSPVANTSTPLQFNESGSETSDGTLNQLTKDDISSGHSLGSEKHVSFAEGLNEERTFYPEIERMDVRVPIDVWISCGEPFISIGETEKHAIQSMKEREERTAISNYLEQDKHILRQMQGRRLAGKCPSTGIDSPVKPVLSKVWDEPSKKEEKLEESIENLQLHLSELKMKQEEEQIKDLKMRPKSAKKIDRAHDRKLYDLPRGISVQVFPNGESPNRAVSVVATNFTELLDRATGRLDLNSAARRAFTVDGTEIFDFDNIEKNQFLCVSVGEKFVPSKDRQHKMELRASWSRLHRDGDEKTNSVKLNSSPVLALPSSSTGPKANDEIEREIKRTESHRRPRTARQRHLKSNKMTT